MARFCVACAVCALLLICVSSSASAAEPAEPADGELCVAIDWQPFAQAMSLAPALQAPRLSGDAAPARRAPFCAGGVDASGQCAIDGPAGSGPDPRPAPRHTFHSACLAAASRPGTPPARVLPRTRSSDARLSPGFARGIERPPRAP